MNVVPKEIVPLGVRAGYLEARRLVSEKKMRLPSHVLHDDYCVKTDRWKGVDEIYSTWASDILVYPEQNGVFQKGKDIVDSETGWVVPAKYIPKEAVGIKGAGLHIIPGEIEENGGVIIHPEGEPVILTPFIQESGRGGQADEATRIPLFVPEGSLRMVPDNDMRWLHRINGVGVRPLVRARFGHGCNGFALRHVYADYDPSSDFGVAGERPLGVLKISRKSGKLVVEGTPEQITAVARLLEQLK